MRQSVQVLAVYRELRQAVGSRVGAAEVLACAASLVKLFAEEEEPVEWDMRENRTPLDMTPVDVALADGGWRVLSREWRQMGWEGTDNCGGARHNWGLA